MVGIAMSKYISNQPLVDFQDIMNVYTVQNVSTQIELWSLCPSQVSNSYSKCISLKNHPQYSIEYRWTSLSYL